MTHAFHGICLEVDGWRATDSHLVLTAQLNTLFVCVIITAALLPPKIEELEDTALQMEDAPRPWLTKGEMLYNRTKDDLRVRCHSQRAGSDTLQIDSIVLLVS